VTVLHRHYILYNVIPNISSTCIRIHLYLYTHTRELIDRLLYVCRAHHDLCVLLTNISYVTSVVVLRNFTQTKTRIRIFLLLTVEIALSSAIPVIVAVPTVSQQGLDDQMTSTICAESHSARNVDSFQRAFSFPCHDCWRSL
jgi:hypothetical protein